MIQESGLNFDFGSNGIVNRLQDCPNYLAISGLGVKEMDFIFFENNSIWCIEVKKLFDHNNPLYLSQNLAIEAIFQKYLNELSIKAIHTLCQISQNRSKTQDCLNTSLKEAFEFADLKIVFILDVPYQTNLAPLQIALKKSLEAVCAVFNCNSIAVLNVEAAKSIGLPFGIS